MTGVMRRAFSRSADGITKSAVKSGRVCLKESVVGNEEEFCRRLDVVRFLGVLPAVAMPVDCDGGSDRASTPRNANLPIRQSMIGVKQRCPWF